MKSLANLKTRRFRRMVSARFMIVAILTSIFLMPSLKQLGVQAQTTCRIASNLPANQIAEASVTRIGVNLWQISWRIKAPHTMICGGPVICDADKFAKKETLNVNVVNASATGACKEFHQFNHIINFNHFEYVVKIKFTENGVTPARKLVKIVFDLGLQTYDELVEYQVTLVDLPDDGDDS